MLTDDGYWCKKFVRISAATLRPLTWSDPRVRVFSMTTQSLLQSILHVLCWGAIVGCAQTEKPMFVFNSDGGANRFAAYPGEITADDVCHELNELEGTAVTVFSWCPNVGGNVFIYPTKIGERMGENIRDWDQVNPYLREHGRSMADNLKKLLDRGEDPIKILSARTKELGVRFWLSMRMNEIHEDDERFNVLRSIFKEKHPELLHGENYHPVAQYAYKKNYSYAWDYGKEAVREHKLAIFREWLKYDVDGIELDFQRSPCLFPPGEEAAGMELMTDFVRKLRAEVDAAGQRRGKNMEVAIRVPPSLQRCEAAGLDVKVWMQLGLVDVVTPMDRGYFDPEPKLREFIALARPRGVKVLGGIEPNVRDYKSTNGQTYAALSNFLLLGADGMYLFNYDCHRRERSTPGNEYTPEEREFLAHGMDRDVIRRHDKQYLVSHCTYRRLADEGGTRPLVCRLPVGELRHFTLTIGDDLHVAERDGRVHSSRLIVKLKKCEPRAEHLELVVNGKVMTVGDVLIEEELVVLTVDAPPINRGENKISLLLKPAASEGGLIYSIDLNVDYKD